jgi:anti-sigma B factor antagonist
MGLITEYDLVNETSEYWKMKLSGEVDIESASKFRTALTEAYSKKPADIVIDASDLNYIDSTGLGVVIGAFGRMNEKGHKIVIEKPRTNIRKLLNITSLDQIFCHIDSDSKA